MRKRILIAIASLAAVFSLSVVGASVLNLTGSDKAPGEGQTTASCARDLVVTNPVSNTGKNKKKITHVDVTGDMNDCVGQTLKVQVDMNSGTSAYGFVKIMEPTQKVSLVFDVKSGNFTDTEPVAEGGELVQQGKLLDPVAAGDFGLVSILLASSWE